MLAKVKRTAFLISHMKSSDSASAMMWGRTTSFARGTRKPLIDYIGFSLKPTIAPFFVGCTLLECFVEFAPQPHSIG